MTNYNFYQHENDVIKYVRENYPAWNNIKENEMCICDNGNVIVGMTEFKTPISIDDYII